MAHNSDFNPERVGAETVSEKSTPHSSDATASPEISQIKDRPREYGTLRWIVVCIAIYSSSFLYGLDNAIVADIQGPLIDDLGEVAKLGWLAIGFPLGSVATILTFGKAYGVFDIKWLYTASFVMFTAGSALCGAAPNMNALIVGRVWAGFGGAGMYLGVLNLVTVNTSLRERPVYLSINGVAFGTGCVLGPIIGGSFADSSATWRWAFYINLVFFGAFAPALIFALKPVSLQPDVPFMQKLLKMDFIGITLNAAMYTLFVMAFTLAGVQWVWNDGRTITMLVIMAVVALAFVASQYFAFLTTTANRLFPGDFLRNKNLVLLYICQSCASTTLFVPIYYIPLYFQFVHGEGGIQAAVRLIPYVIIAMAASMFQGAMFLRLPYAAPWFLVASICAVLGSGLFYGILDTGSPVSYVYGFSVPLGIGAGLGQQVAYSVAATLVAPDRVSDAIGFINTAQIGSSVIALTIASAIFQNVGLRRVSDVLGELGYSRMDMQDALSGYRSVVLQELSSDVHGSIVEGIAKTINEQYILIIAAGALGTIASIFLPWKRLNMSPATAGAM
ncbi:MFS general substrate transporter [Periconia macrospinosa]|uniref:MFS general substrate transporter n=1 Tax=Periconia macrospinosa TaxID=97972 RepID=A0A2V1DXN7_9PLEO|nr:MFS general substrate transporter [Periconia macrospinosa]